MKLLTSAFFTLLLTQPASGQSDGASESLLSDIRGSDFSVLIESDRDSILFVFHQEDLLVYSDHSLFPWIGQTHTGSLFNGFVVDYNINGMTYEQLLEDGRNRTTLTSQV
jgi:hypothetical protein